MNMLLFIGGLGMSEVLLIALAYCSFSEARKSRN